MFTLQELSDAYSITLTQSSRRRDKPEPSKKPKGPRRRALVPGGDIAEEVALSLRGHQKLEDYVAALARVWPIVPSFRHELAIRAASDLYRHGAKQKEAEKIFKAACKQAGDEEVDDRLKALRSTYQRISRGETVAGLAGEGAEKTNFPASHWGRDLRTLPPKERSNEAERRILAVLVTTFIEEDGSRKTTTRQLAEQTGTSKTTSSKVLRKLSKRGWIKTAHDERTRTTKVWLKEEIDFDYVQDSVQSACRLLSNSASERARLERLRSGHAIERKRYRKVNARSAKSSKGP